MFKVMLRKKYFPESNILFQDTEIIIIGLTYNLDERKPGHFWGVDRSFSIF